jgi:hypothetical protein
MRSKHTSAHKTGHERIGCQWGHRTNRANYPTFVPLRDAKLPARRRIERLQRMKALNVLGLQPFFAGDDIERNLLTLVQSFETGADN